MRITLSILALVLLAPLPAHAYLTPEEVLEEEDYVAPPPNARNAKAARAAQEAEYDARAAREAEENAAVETPDDVDGPGSNTIDDLHGSADDWEEIIDWEETGSGLDPEERRNQRVLERVERQRLDDMAAGVVLHGSAPEPLHGGAPLAPTGMGTVVSLLVGAAAIGYTLRKALRA